MKKNISIFKIEIFLNYNLNQIKVKMFLDSVLLCGIGTLLGKNLDKILNKFFPNKKNFKNNYDGWCEGG